MTDSRKAPSSSGTRGRSKHTAPTPSHAWIGLLHGLRVVAEDHVALRVLDLERRSDVVDALGGHVVDPEAHRLVGQQEAGLGVGVLGLDLGERQRLVEVDGGHGERRRVGPLGRRRRGGDVLVASAEQGDAAPGEGLAEGADGLAGLGDVDQVAVVEHRGPVGDLADEVGGVASRAGSCGPRAGTRGCGRGTCAGTPRRRPTAPRRRAGSSGSTLIATAKPSRAYMPDE